MNKAELIASIADGAHITKASAEYALNSAIETIIKTVTKGEDVQLIGFSIFKSGKRAARFGRNPALVLKLELRKLGQLNLLLVKYLKTPLTSVNN
jgi:nucleoid DNA-binding protein